MRDSDAAAAHEKLMQEHPRYRHTAGWNPVLFPSAHSKAGLAWLEKRLGKRGDRIEECRWSHAVPGLYLIEDPVTAVEFKLKFG
jgi:hypothetical protein